MGYRISVKAQEDIENIWHYTLKKWSIVQADRYVNLIIDEIEYLVDNPVYGRDFGQIREHYRYSKVKSHLIFYRNGETQIEVIRVLHQRMDIENRLND